MKASEVEEVMAGRGGRYRHSNKVEAIEEVVEKVENYASMQSAVPGTVKLESWSWKWTKNRPKDWFFGSNSRQVTKQDFLKDEF